MTHSILFVMTGADSWTLNDGSKHKTGFWAEEAVVPLEVFREAGYAVTVATPRRRASPPGRRGQSQSRRRRIRRTRHTDAHLVDTDPELQDPISLSDVDISDYDAVFVPGGHGPMEDLAVDTDAGALLIAADQAKKTIGVVCHGPAILLAATGEDGVNVFSGRTVTCFATPRSNRPGSPTRPPRGCSRTGSPTPASR